MKKLGFFAGTLEPNPPTEETSFRTSSGAH